MKNHTNPAGPTECPSPDDEGAIPKVGPKAPPSFYQPAPDVKKPSSTSGKPANTNPPAQPTKKK